MQGNGMASAKQLALPLEQPGDEPVAGKRENSPSVQPSPWMNCQIICANTGGRFGNSRSGRPTDPNRSVGSPSPKSTAVPARWAFLRCWIALSSKQSLRLSSRTGNPASIHTAMASVRDALRIKRSDTDSTAPGKVVTGWWIWTWKPSLIG